MSNIHVLESQDRRFDEASVWIAKLENGLTEDDENSLQLWMAADQENQAVFFKMAEMWDTMDTMSQLRDLFPREVKQKTRSPHIFMAIAASILVAVIIGVFGVTSTLPNMLLGLKSGAQLAGVSGLYETAIGEHSVVNLPDGTALLLNTNSLIKVNYTDNHRLIKLERGEIHVQVAHDKSRPLSVLAGGKIVQAVGTAFNIQIHSDQQIELVVTEGKVLVGVHQRHKQSANFLKDEDAEIVSSSSGPVIEVSKGEGVLLSETEEEVQKIESEDIEVKLSWMEGNLIFRGESLEDAMTQVGRYTSVEFIILDEQLKKVRISGMFKVGDVDGLLKTLRENFNISYTREGVDKEKVVLKER